MIKTKTYINSEWCDDNTRFSNIDLSDVYTDELDNLQTTSLDDDQMKTFLFECLDEELDFVWGMIKHRCFDDSHLIDFDSGYLYENYDIEIILSNELIVTANVNIFFKIDYYVNNPRYDSEDTNCYHNYEPFSVSIISHKIKQ